MHEEGCRDGSDVLSTTRGVCTLRKVATGGAGFGLCAMMKSASVAQGCDGGDARWHYATLLKVEMVERLRR